MHIFLAADHAGFYLKEALKHALVGTEHTVEDFGAFTFQAEDDYPLVCFRAAHAVAEAPEERRAILLGGSGQGEAMAANRVPGVRATVYYGGTMVDADTGHDIIALSRLHNDANVLSFGARFVSEDEAIKVVMRWLTTPFSGDVRHIRRIDMLDRPQ